MKRLLVWAGTVFQYPRSDILYIAMPHSIVSSYMPNKNYIYI